MRYDMSTQTEKYAKAHLRKKRWHRLLTALSCIVVFCTVYALIIPAITLSKTTACGYEEHKHDEKCYDESGNLICKLPEHIHNENCYRTALEILKSLKKDAGEIIPVEEVDVTDGPVVQITAIRKDSIPDWIKHGAGDKNNVSSDVNEEVEIDTGDDLQQVESEQTSASSKMAPKKSSGENIRTYVLENGGSFGITLLNSDNTEPDKDADGNYIVTEGDNYKLSLGINAPNGIAPGAYYYNLPEGLTVNGGNGEFVVNGVNIGNWSVDTSGRVTFNFNQNANIYTNIIISASMGVTFRASDHPIVFDGNISVIVKKPQLGEGFKLNKWGSFIEQNGEKTQIKWNVEVASEPETLMVGKTITDSINRDNTSNHTYSDADKAAGIKITGTDPNGITYTWTVKGNNDGLTWIDNGWKYIFPATIRTDDGKEVNLGKGWQYKFQYTTTLCDDVTVGIVPYKNTVVSDGVSANGYKSQNKAGTEIGYCDKDGYLNNNKFHWIIDATLSGWTGTGKYGKWQFYDWMKIKDKKNIVLPDDLPYIGHPKKPNKGNFNSNYPENIKVTIVRGEERINVPFYTEAKSTDRYAYEFEYSTEGYNWWLRLMMPCQCTIDTCCKWRNGKCSYNVNGWCRCWHETEDISVQIEYDTPADVALDRYGGIGNKVENNVEIYPDSGNPVSSALVRVVVPGAFKKDLREDPSGMNDYIAAYTITVNEGHFDLSGQNTLQIVDTMTETLVYVPGTMVITAQNTVGNVRTLIYGTDYTLEYNAQEHKIIITVYNPGTEMYTLQYDAQIVIPDNVTSVSYSNSATVELFGKQMSTETEEKVVADISIAAKNYEVTIDKIDAQDGSALAGAEFGLFTENGEKITSGFTDENGQLSFKTDVLAAVILKEHIAYYIKELTAPQGYGIDYNKHWIVFCDKDSNCSVCASLINEHAGMVRVPANKGVTIELTNVPAVYELPHTGGIGTIVYVAGGFALMAGSLFTGCVLRRKRERRSEMPP